MTTTGAGQSPILLLQVVALLRESRVDYAAIGAIAASVHGVVRATLDADAALKVTIQELSALQKSFVSQGLETELRRGGPDDPIAGMLILTDAFGNRVDLLAGLRGLESSAYDRAIDVPFSGETLRVIGREDFIAMKCFAGGPVDLVDARRAIAVDKESLNTDLLKRLLVRFGKDAIQNYERIAADL